MDCGRWRPTTRGLHGTSPGGSGFRVPTWVIGPGHAIIHHVMNSEERTCYACGRAIAEHEDPLFYGKSSKGPVWVCSTNCRKKAIRTALRQVRCAVCSAPVQQSPGPGRPTAYCSKTCAKARERQLARAMRDLARNSTADSSAKLDELIADAGLLASFWRGELETKPTGEIDARARRALSARINDLHARLRGAIRYEHYAHLDEVRRREAERAARAAEQAAKEDAKWRAGLTATMGSTEEDG